MSFVTFSQRLKMELGNRKPSEITDLFMDGCKSDEIDGLTAEYSSLKYLSLVNVGLTSLKNLPELSSLAKIDISENRISDNLTPLSKCLKLQSINLSSNKIKSLDVLKPLIDLPKLTCLDLKDNEIEKYKEKVIELFPNLHILDGVNLKKGTLADTEDDSEEILDEDDEDDDEFDDEEEESYGLQALQNSEDLEDDENDYNPGEEDGEDEDELGSEFDDEDNAEEIGEMSKEDIANRKRKAAPREDNDSNDAVPNKLANGEDDDESND